MTRLVTVGAALVAALLSGCTAPGLDPTVVAGAPAPAVSYDYAVERVEQLISAAVPVLTSTPELELLSDIEVPCGGNRPVGVPLDDRVTPSRSYFVRGLPPDRTTAELVTTMVDHWTAQGYRTAWDARPQSQVVGVGDSEGFTITIEVNAFDDVALIASGPCVVPTSAHDRPTGG